MIRVFKGNRSPSVSDTIKVAGVAFDLTGSTVRFRMRLSTSATLKVDGAAVVVSAPAGTVRYDWAALDVDTTGTYVAWWSVTLASGAIQDTPEFTVVVLDHAEAATVDLVTVAQVKEFLEVPDSDVARDPLIASLITPASQAIIDYTEREFMPQSTGVTRRFRVNVRGTLRDRPGIMVDFGQLNACDLRTATTLVLHPEATTPVTLASATDYKLEPEGAPSGVYTHLFLFSGLSYASTTLQFWGFCYLDVTGNWGFPAVPIDVQDACIKTVASWLRRDMSSIANVAPDGTMLAPHVGGGFDLPAGVKRRLVRWQRRIGF